MATSRQSLSTLLKRHQLSLAQKIQQRIQYFSVSRVRHNGRDENEQTDNMKDDIKNRPEPTMGSTFQGASHQKVEEAGYERAREDGERIREAPGFIETAKAVGQAAADATTGVMQAATKIGEMTKEAAGRAAETGQGLFMGSEPKHEHGTSEHKEENQEPQSQDHQAVKSSEDNDNGPVVSIPHEMPLSTPKDEDKHPGRAGGFASRTSLGSPIGK